jgi:hypothetical protein
MDALRLMRRLPMTNWRGKCNGSFCLEKTSTLDGSDFEVRLAL